MFWWRFLQYIAIPEVRFIVLQSVVFHFIVYKSKGCSEEVKHDTDRYASKAPMRDRSLTCVWFNCEKR